MTGEEPDHILKMIISQGWGFLLNLTWQCSYCSRFCEDMHGWTPKKAHDPDYSLVKQRAFVTTLQLHSSSLALAYEESIKKRVKIDSNHSWCA